MSDCSQNTDPLKLVREGTSQDDRVSAALDPSSAPTDSRTVAHDIVFAQGYAQLLRHFDKTNAPPGDWSDYFGSDTAVLLAVAAIEDVEAYKTTVRTWFNFLNDIDNTGQTVALTDRLSYLYAAISTLAQALDGLWGALPNTVALRGTIFNLIRTQLAPALTRLVAYYKGGIGLGVVTPVAPPGMQVLRRPVGPFDQLLAATLSNAWSTTPPWAAYVGIIAADDSVYGDPTMPDAFQRINHCTTHPLFRSIFDQFLKVYARVVSEAQAALTDNLANFSGHAPHYALYLAFLQLLNYTRTAGNTLTQRHLDFYYRTILGLKEKPAEPGSVFLLAELAKQASSYDFVPGQLFKAGKDSAGKDVVFANDTDFVANKASVASLKTVYRHGSEPLADGTPHQDRIFASPVANSDDGQGAPLHSVDQSWQPFFNKVYTAGELSTIKMPKASIGFAIASHYLLLAEGNRAVDLMMSVGDGPLQSVASAKFTDAITCALSTAKGWLIKKPSHFEAGEDGKLRLRVNLSGADPAIVPYSSQVHGYNFDTTLPLLLVQLVQDDTQRYVYYRLQDVWIDTVDLTVTVEGMRMLVVSNDFGPLDLSKPFQPFGSSPVAGSSLLIGSKEVFQKHLRDARINLTWQVSPAVYPATDSAPDVNVDFLQAGTWVPSSIAAMSIAPSANGQTNTVAFTLDAVPVVDVPDFTPDVPYGTQSVQGFCRMSLTQDIGQDKYQAALIAYLSHPKDKPNPGSRPPQGPVASALTLSYTASSTLPLNTKDQFESRPGQLFHLAPFGTAERHAYLDGGDAVRLLPQFSIFRGGATLPSEAEFYIGIAGLQPPQNLSLLFQVVDGTANPLALKPVPHIDWCYLSQNHWVEFPENTISDGTDEILNSGIISLALPADATSDNTLMPAGQFWIRAAVETASDAVCRLQLVAAQGMEVTFLDRGNAPDFSATTLAPGTIAKLVTPDAAVKSISQPFASFGGRGAEAAQDFYRRISERLRHKNRAIDLWDYERLILEAYPQIYKVKCLNHTEYEPADSTAAAGPSSGGIYRELAPGHVTIVTLPNLQLQHQLDPLKPYTSLGLLQDIQTFLKRRCSCMAQLHVRNPQFEEVRVSFGLKMRDGYDVTYYTLQLKQAITRFLSPWAFSGVGVPSFGGKIYKSVLINFVEQQPCVDYVTDFMLFQDIPGQPPGGVDLDEVSGSRAVSVLVSAAPGMHQISTLDASSNAALAESCGCGA